MADEPRIVDEGETRDSWVVVDSPTPAAEPAAEKEETE